MHKSKKVRVFIPEPFLFTPYFTIDCNAEYSGGKKLSCLMSGMIIKAPAGINDTAYRKVDQRNKSA